MKGVLARVLSRSGWGPGAECVPCRGATRLRVSMPGTRTSSGVGAESEANEYTMQSEGDDSTPYPRIFINSTLLLLFPPFKIIMCRIVSELNYSAVRFYDGTPYANAL